MTLRALGVTVPVTLMSRLSLAYLVGVATSSGSDFTPHGVLTNWLDSLINPEPLLRAMSSGRLGCGVLGLPIAQLERMRRR